jgi:hypothetical protein
MKTKSLIKESHAIAFIYGCFGIMYSSIIAITIILASHYGLGPIVAVKAASGTLIYLLALSLINIIMAILAWKIVSLSNRVQRTVIVFAIFLAISAIINLITAISSWFPRKMPD